MGKKKPKYNHETRHLRNPTFNVQFELPILPQLPQSLYVSSINHSIDSGDSRTSGQFECAVNRALWWLSGDVGEDVTLLSPLSEKCIAYLSKTDLDHLVSLAFQTAPDSSQFALWYYSRERSDSPLIPCICSSSALRNTACQDDKHNKWLPTKGITLWKKTNLSHLTNLSQISCGALM